MVRKLVVFVFVFTLASAYGLSESTAQDKDKKEKSGTVIGELKSRKGLLLEILGDGEEKARAYYVPSGPNAKGTLAEVLSAVNTARIGDRVQCDWSRDIPRGEGNIFVTAFKVLKKADPKKDNGKEK